MNTAMNANEKKAARSNKSTTTVIIGLATLVLGLVIGAATAETGTGLMRLAHKGSAATNQSSSAAAGNLKTDGLENWNPFQEIRAMQSQMDQSFDQMFQQFRMDTNFNVFNENPGYSLSLNVQDLKNRYEVQAFLPDAKASDVHVSLKNGRTLDVQVNSKEAQTCGQTNATSNVTELGEYDQVVQLPTPVKADQMKITRNGHELLITIPKAT